MKKKATKLIAVILTALMLMSMLPVTASAAEATMDSVGSASGTTGDCTWKLVDRVLTISGNGAMGNYNPHPVTTPKAPWMDYAINKVVIENGVTSIGTYAFSGCDGITSVSIPNSVKTIRSDAFEDCISLTSISIPNSVTSIGMGVFCHCRSLTSISIPNSVTSIAEATFWDCTSLTSVYIPSSVTSIGSGVFEGCSSLISVYIPSSVTSIDSYAFYGCTDMTFAVIPNSVKSIGNFAFGYYGDNQEKKVNGFTIYGYQNSAAQTYANNNGFPFVAINGYDGCGNCILVKKSDGTMIICGKGEMGYTPVNYNFGSYMDGDTKVIIMDGITDISSTAFFSGRDKLKSIQIPNSVTSIGYSAFHMCTGLTSIVIPDSVATIGVDAFEYCTGLKNLTFGAGFTGITSEKGIISPKLSFKRIFGVGGCPNLESITVNAGNSKYDSRNNCNAVIETASNSLILGCKNTVIPDSVTSIASGAFSDCVGLTTIRIPENVTSIAYDAFASGSDLTIYGKKGSRAETYANANGFTFIEDPSVYQYQLLDDGTAKITGYTGGGGNITIPSELDGHAVTVIGNDAFRRCTSLNTVTIPDTVTSIDDWAFANSTISAVSIPDSVTSIGYYAFSGCSSLSSVTIPNSVTSIGAYVFHGCSSLVSVTIPDSVTSIDYRAFYDCSSLSSVIIPDSVTSIDSYAFYNCSSLTSVTIPKSVTNIGNDCFARCAKLTNITVENGNTVYCSINGNLYNKDKSTLIQYAIGKTESSFTIPNSVTSIGMDAFINCRSLTSVTIPQTVNSIGADAFCDCHNLKTITIPNSVSTIGIRAFGYYCNGSVPFPKIDGFTITGYKNSAAETYANENGFNFVMLKEYPDFNYRVLSDGTAVITGYTGNGGAVTIPSSIDHYTVTGVGDSAFHNCKTLTSVTIPNSVTSIGRSAFSSCSNMTAVTIPDSVTSIGAYAFYGCSGLTTVTIPNSVTSIGDGAFCGCSGLTAVTIPNSVTSIGYSAFEDCSGLTSVTIPDSVTSIGEFAFGYNNFESIVVAPGNTVYDSRGNCNAIIKTATNTLICGCKNTVIPDSVTSIDGAFSSPGLTSITIPDSVVSIGVCAFSGSGLTSITIPNSVTSIDYWAFSECDNLTSITIPESVTTISYEAFSYCENLTSVTIPDSVTTISYGAFLNCHSLKNITIPNTCTSIDSYAFSNCSSLTAVTIPETVTNIGYRAFGYLSIGKVDGFTITGYKDSAAETYANENGFNFIMLKEYPDFTYQVLSDGTAVITGYTGNGGAVTIPSSIDHYTVTGVGDSAFYNCKTLTSVTIPDSVTSIGRSAFSGCSNLTAVTIPNSVTSIGSLAFYGCTGLTSVTIPNSVTSVGNWAFNDCDSLNAVTIPDTVTNIGYEAFGYLSNGKINGFTITGKTGSAAETYAKNNGFIFNDPSVFEYRILNDGTAEITGYTGSGGDITIPSVIDDHTVTSIGEAAFWDYRGLTSVIIPNSVTDIGNGAFYGCSGLTSVTIPNSVICIGAWAFFRCSGLTSVIIPNSVTSIGELVFSFNDLESIVVAPGNTVYDSRGNCNAIIETATNKLIYGCKNTVIPNSATSIEEYAFYGCSNLNSVIIPNSVTSIAHDAFDDCDNVTIYGIKGSFAETYATENEIPFIFICPHCGSTNHKTIPKISATCDKAGMTEGVYCADCGEWIEVPKPIPPIPPIPGDVNGDGVITVEDATMLQRFLAEFIELDLTNENVFIQADMNKDGHVNVKDVTGIQRKVAELF